MENTASDNSLSVHLSICRSIRWSDAQICSFFGGVHWSFAWLSKCFTFSVLSSAVWLTVQLWGSWCPQACVDQPAARMEPPTHLKNLPRIQLIWEPRLIQCRWLHQNIKKLQIVPNTKGKVKCTRHQSKLHVLSWRLLQEQQPSNTVKHRKCCLHAGSQSIVQPHKMPIEKSDYWLRRVTVPISSDGRTSWEQSEWTATKPLYLAVIGIMTVLIIATTKIFVPRWTSTLVRSGTNAISPDFASGLFCNHLVFTVNWSIYVLALLFLCTRIEFDFITDWQSKRGTGNWVQNKISKLSIWAMAKRQVRCLDQIHLLGTSSELPFKKTFLQSHHNVVTSLEW